MVLNIVSQLSTYICMGSVLATYQYQQQDQQNVHVPLMPPCTYQVKKMWVLIWTRYHLKQAGKTMHFPLNI